MRNPTLKIITAARVKAVKHAKKLGPNAQTDPAKLRNYFADRFAKLLCEAERGRTLENCIYVWVVADCSSKYIPSVWSNKVFKRAYITKSADISFNLSNPNNTYFLENVISRSISLEQVPSMTHHDMYPKLRQNIFEKREQKEIANMLWNNDISFSSGIFKCPKCKQHSTTYYSLQTRSADEPMTNYITCMSCEYRWKE